MSKILGAKITALGTYVPPRLLTNQDLEKMVETSDQWIVERTGIRTRHIAEAGTRTLDLARAAGEKALEAAWDDQFNDTIPATGHCLSCGDRCDDLTSQGLCDRCDSLATDATIACQNKAAMGQYRVF